MSTVDYQVKPQHHKHQFTAITGLLGCISAVLHVQEFVWLYTTQRADVGICFNKNVTFITCTGLHYIILYGCLVYPRKYVHMRVWDSEISFHLNIPRPYPFNSLYTHSNRKVSLVLGKAVIWQGRGVGCGTKASWTWKTKKRGQLFPSTICNHVSVMWLVAIRRAVCDYASWMKRVKNKNKRAFNGSSCFQRGERQPFCVDL